MSDKTYGFETLSVHAGAAPDPATGARALPIYQTTAYVFEDADHAAALFNLQTVGFIYSRLTNPTNAALETRLATLEGGRGCTVASSGHAAQVLALFPLAMHGGPLWQPLCYAQIGGLTVATFITLLMVPVLYSIMVLDLKWLTWEEKPKQVEATAKVAGEPLAEGA